MRALRWRLAMIPFVGYCFRWAVIDGGNAYDLALTKRAAIRRLPAVPNGWAHVRPVPVTPR